MEISIFINVQSLLTVVLMIVMVLVVGMGGAGSHEFE